MRGLRIGWLVLILVVMGWGQREDTVFDTVFEDLATKPFYSAPVRNIGQSSHILTLIATDAPAQTCVSPATVDVGLEYSYDNVTYIRAAGQITRVSANDDGVLTTAQNVAGAYPFMRAVVRSFEDTTCRLTGKYSGAVAAFNINNVGTNNNFLGINAVSTLNSADPGINFQATPSTPVITTNSSTTDIGTGHRQFYDAITAGAWTKTDTQQASLTVVHSPQVCGSVEGNTITFNNGSSSATFTATAFNTGYTTSTFQCNYDLVTLVDLLDVNQAIVGVSLVASNITYAAESGPTPGFRGNGLTITCTGGVQAAICGGSSPRYLVNGITTLVSQTTDDGLAACVYLSDSNANNATVLEFRDATCTTPLSDQAYIYLANSNSYTIYVDDYQIFMYQDGTGSSIANVGNNFGIGVPYIPDFVAGVTSFIWMYSDNKQDFTIFADNWRNTMTPSNGAAFGVYGASVYFNGVTYDQNNLTILGFNPSTANWVNASGNPLMDAIIRFQVGGPSGTDTLIGQLWNAVYYQANIVANTPFSFLGYTFDSFTNSSATGTLLFRQN